MKKIILYTILLLFVFMFSACNNDFLNTKPLDKFGEDQVWSDVNMAQGFVFDTYESVVPLLLKNPYDNAQLGAAMDDLSDNVNLKQSNAVNKDQIDKYFDAGWNVFDAIRKCNLIIEKVSESDGIVESGKKELIAQGKMLRALVYYRQARMFGKFVIVDKVLTQDDDLKLSRTSTIKETYDFILKDLEEAIVDLPIEAPAGKLTKGAALAIKAEIALHGAAYIESGKTDYYQIAKKASEDLFNLGVYELDQDYIGLFNNYENALKSKETILGYFMHEDNTRLTETCIKRLLYNISNEKMYDWATPKLNTALLGWVLRFPSKELVDDYLVIDNDGVAKRWNETSYYKNFVTKKGYVSNAIYKKRDLRFYSSVVHDSSMFLTNLVSTRVGGNLHRDARKIGVSGTVSSYYFRKGITDDAIEGNPNINYAYQIMRLGRAYLNYAEVMLRLNRVDVALEYVNKTRTVHGGLPELSTSLTLEEAWKWYRIERRVELFFENDRYWSLLRWGKEAGDIIIPELNRKLQAFEIAEDGKSFSIGPMPLYDVENERKFTVKRYLFPVPENEILLNEALDQNPGW